MHSELCSDRILPCFSPLPYRSNLHLIEYFIQFFRINEYASTCSSNSGSFLSVYNSMSSARLSILVILSCLSGFCSKFQIVLVQIIRCNTGDVVCNIPKQDSVACYRRHPVSVLPNEEFQRLCFFGHTSVRISTEDFKVTFAQQEKASSHTAV